ncbi:MAG TPA: HAMP domain-containing protein [Phycisphaerales bacterium]|nr:HAMP domain-containing protein [Phycisphaerales bacterium]
MRLSLRWKLPLVAVVPLVGVAVALALTAYRSTALRHESEFEARTQRLTSSIAAQLDAQLASAASMARATAVAVAVVPQIEESQLAEILRRTVESDRLIYGACVAFEPFGLDPRRRLVAPYVFRRGSELVAIDIGGDSYDYTDEAWEWYARPMATGRAAWTEPYFDTDAGETLMCTFAVPILRDGAPIGVATVDVAVDELRRRIELDRFESARFMLLSRSGRVIDGLAPGSAAMHFDEYAASIGRSDLAAVANLLRHGRRGIVRLDALEGDGRAWFVVAPVPMAGWSLAVVVPESARLAGPKRQMNLAMPSLLASLVVIGACVWLAARRLTRPIEHLAGAAEAVGRGNLDIALPPPRDDELGTLIGSFDRMIEALRRREAVPPERRLESDAGPAPLRGAPGGVAATATSAAVPPGDRTRTGAKTGSLAASAPSATATSAPSEARARRAASLGAAATPRGVIGLIGAHAVDDARADAPRYVLERSGVDELAPDGDLVDGLVRRDGRLVLAAIGAAGGGIQGSSAALAVRGLLRGLASTTDDPALMLRETARLVRGLDVPVSATLALYDPASGEAAFAIAGDSSVRLQRGPGESLSLGSRTIALGERGTAPGTTGSRSPGADSERAGPASTSMTVILAPGDRLTIRSRAGRSGECARWTLTRLA